MEKKTRSHSGSELPLDGDQAPAKSPQEGATSLCPAAFSGGFMLQLELAVAELAHCEIEDLVVPQHVASSTSRSNRIDCAVIQFA